MLAGKKQVPESLHIEMLGGFRVWAGGHAIAAAQWNQRKVRGLFKLLALASGQRLHREQMLEALWPALEPEAASNNLHRATHAVRRILEPALTPNQPSAYLRTEDDMLVLCAPGGLWIDIAAFQAAAREAQATHSTQAYAAALELYAGDLLPDDRYEDWAAAQREHLRQGYITLLEELAHLRVNQGEAGAAVATFERLLLAEPAHEGAHVALMRLHARTGRRYQALRQFQRLCAVLRRELDIAPEPSIQRLADDIRLGAYPRADHGSQWSAHPTWRASLLAGADETAEAIEAAAPEPPVVAIPAGTRTNLTSQFTSFIGRVEELAALGSQLAGTRLLTLRGGGGCGKSRLAWQVGASQLDGYRDGVWMIELAALVNPALVPQAVAGALGVSEAADQPLSATLAAALRERELLLVLDNCEHLLDAVAALARELLAACPGLRILATSRRSLRVTGEQVWRVPSMTAPDPDDLPPFERLLEYDAIQLFVARAAANRAGFRLTPQNALAVVRICHRLDGIPLAIELAAGRSRLLTADQIAARLDDAFALLTHGDSTQLPRQQTLRASIAWSEQLLSAAERTLLRRLAVFAGGWTLDATEAICVGEGLDPSQVLDALGGLVDASLVIAEEHPDGMRYRMLEMTRQYAAERLRAAENSEVIGRRHAAWYVALAEDAEHFLTGPQQPRWMARLDVEGDNLRSALRWARARRDPTSGQRLAGALMRFWYTRGMVSEGSGWLDEMLALGEARAADEPVPDAVRARALFGAGWLALFRGALERAEALVTESLQLAEATGDARGTLRAVSGIAVIQNERGDYDGAMANHMRSLTLARQLGDRYRIAVTLSNLADMAFDASDYPLAARLYSECLVAAREAEDVSSIVMGLTNLGDVTLRQGDAARARSLLEEALALARTLGEPRRLAAALEVLGQLATSQRASAHALIYLREALELRWNAGNIVETCFSLDAIAVALASMGESERAVRLFAASAALREAIGSQLRTRERELNDPALAALRAALSPDTFAAAWAAGAVLPIGQIVAEVLRASERVPTESQPRTRRRSKPRESGAPAMLSAREQEVARLIAAGLTNREIAGQLRIAERTIDTHVSNILGKLDMVSRDAVAAWWQRVGAAATGQR